MKTTYIILLLMFCASVSAQQTQTSEQAIEDILSVAEHRDELVRVKNEIDAFLSDQRLTDQATREMLMESKNILNEMLNQKIGTNTRKLVDFAKWMREQGESKSSLKEESNLNEQQQLILDNPLAGNHVYISSIIHHILMEYLIIDKENSGNDNINSLLRIYFEQPTLEEKFHLADQFLWNAPQWLQQKYPQLTDEQKRMFLEDVNDAITLNADDAAPDREPRDAPAPEAQAAYDTIYQFIVNNTPPENNPPEE